ncbi:MAG: molecular chaperone DnaK [Deltaproteobacteria bacterium]|nr:molecular chaperone DnaK [Deltaproteobacteria bacterium]
MAIKNVIGIDLGTVNSGGAIMRDGKPVVLVDDNGHDTFPSIFAINSNDQILVGFEAEEQADINRLNTIFAVKRLIGRKYDSPDVQEAIKNLPYKIISAKNGDAWVEVNGLKMSPEEVSGHILKYLKDMAERRLGEPVTHAVISVPAHFNDSQRQATRDAGAIAGLTVLNIINEPTAAALAYGIDLKDSNKDERIIAVFDLGGGTFDITVLGLRQGLFDVKSTGGDTFLGGEDFDLAMVAFLLEQFQKQTSIDLKSNRMALQRIKTAARNARHELSFQTSVELKVPFLAAGKGSSGTEDLTVPLHRRDMEKLFGELVARLDPPCLKALLDAGLKADDLDDVVLVGGMTRMPIIRKQCRKIFARQPIDTVNPDTAVQVGAAIQGALMQGILAGLNLADVTPLTLGVEVQGGMCVPIIPRNTKVPAKITKIFSTSGPQQKEIDIHVVQGESHFAYDNKSLGFFKLTEIPSAPRGKPHIAITLNVDTDGIVHVNAQDQESGERKSLQIFASSGLSDENLNALVRENRTLENEKKRRDEKMDQREAELATRAIKEQEAADRRNLETFVQNMESQALKELKDQLRTLIFQTQFSLDKKGKRFKGEKREALDQCLQYARQTMDNVKDEEEIKQTIKEVQSHLVHYQNYLESLL